MKRRVEMEKEGETREVIEVGDALSWSRGYA